jgi:hypothetical protein
MTTGGQVKAFFADRVVTELEFEITGPLSTNSDDTFTAAGLTGFLEAFNYGTRTLIDGVSFDSLNGTFLGEFDFQWRTEGTALVKGIKTNITFDASFIQGVISVEISNADTGESLGGGIGEDGRSTLFLDLS